MAPPGGQFAFEEGSSGPRQSREKENPEARPVQYRIMLWPRLF